MTYRTRLLLLQCFETAAVGWIYFSTVSSCNESNCCCCGCLLRGKNDASRQEATIYAEKLAAVSTNSQDATRRSELQEGQREEVVKKL